MDQSPFAYGLLLVAPFDTISTGFVYSACSAALLALPGYGRICNRNGRKASRHTVGTLSAFDLCCRLDDEARLCQHARTQMHTPAQTHARTHSSSSSSTRSCTHITHPPTHTPHAHTCTLATRPCNARTCSHPHKVCHSLTLQRRALGTSEQGRQACVRKRSDRRRARPCAKRTHSVHCGANARLNPKPHQPKSALKPAEIQSSARCRPRGCDVRGASVAALQALRR